MINKTNVNFILAAFIGGLILFLAASVFAQNQSKPNAKILLIPLDDRPPCLQFPVRMGAIGDAEIVTPPRETMMFMPQRPYLPLGTLKGALAYPANPERFSTEDATAALERVGLSQLPPRLDEEERWDRVLSLGEQQRLAFARLLLHKPAWIFMDEATAALDEKNQDAMMQLVLDELPDSALISIGHRPGLEAFHTRTLKLQRAEGGARLSKPPPRPRKTRKRWGIPRWKNPLKLAGEA